MCCIVCFCVVCFLFLLVPLVGCSIIEARPSHLVIWEFFMEDVGIRYGGQIITGLSYGKESKLAEYEFSLVHSET